MAHPDLRLLYEALVRSTAPELYRFAFRATGDAAHAEDLVQETFFHAWRSLGSLRDPAAGRAWLYTILRRRWAHELRGQRRRPRLEAFDEAVEAAASPLSGPSVDLFAQRESVQAALNRLDPRLKEPFLLVFQAGLSCREAAERLDVPRGTVLSRLHRARAFLRAFLAEPSSDMQTRPQRSEDGGRA